MMSLIPHAQHDLSVAYDVILRSEMCPVSISNSASLIPNTHNDLFRFTTTVYMTN